MTMIRLASQKQLFGRTDLRTSLSGAKFDAEADFDVRSDVAPAKPHKITVTNNRFPIPHKINFFPNRFFDVLGVAKRRRRLEF